MNSNTMDFVTSVPVEFWGHVYPHGKFEISYSLDTKGWNYTPKSAQRGDKPICDWIEENFKPIHKPDREGVRYVGLVRTLKFDGYTPVKMKFGLQEALVIPEEFQEKMNSWKYWLSEPRPDDSKYYRNVNLDKEVWQYEDAKIKKRGTFFE